MAASNLDLDLEGTNPANQFSGEQRSLNLNVDRSVWPENYPFYINDGYFKLEGRIGGGSWFTLKESVDYVFSPLFPEYSISTGKEIVSYFVITNDSLTSVRYNYKALGKYIDQNILREITSLQNEGLLDRASVVSWQRVVGHSPAFALPEDPSVIGRSWEEVMTLKLQEIVTALLMPNSTTAILPKDITAINLLLSRKVDRNDIIELVLANSIQPISASPFEDAQVLPIGSNIAAFTAVLSAIAQDDTSNVIVSFKAYKDRSDNWQIIEDEQDIQIESQDHPVLSIAQQGVDYVLIARSRKAVVYQLKLLSRFEGV